MWKYSVSSTNYATSGTYESQPIALDYVDSDIAFTVNQNIPSNTAITYESAMSDDAINWDDYSPISIVSNSGTITPHNHHKYAKIRITLESTDASQTNTPTVYDYTLSYNSNSNPPTNPTTINASSKETNGVALTDDQPGGYAYAHPYFFWSGATHNGSGIAGYYVCFDTDSHCTDPENDGTFQTANTYTVNAPLKTGTYHLKIKTKDNNGNLSDTVLDAFSYLYDGVSVPEESESLNAARTSDNDFNAGTLTDASVIGSGDGASMRLAPMNGSWGQSRLSVSPAGINNGGEMALANCKKTGEVGIQDNEKCLYTIGGNNTLPFYSYQIFDGSVGDTWATLQNLPANATAGAALTPGPNNTLYGTRGTSATAPVDYRAFWTYDIASNTWTALTDAPRDFNRGSSLTYDGGHYIYAIPGSDDAFYRYNTQTGNWTGLANIQFGNPNTVNGQFTSEGSDSIYDGRNNLYVTQGNQFPYFARYSISTDASHGEVGGTWTPLRPAPIGFYYSGSLTYDSATNAIYAITGNSPGSSNSRQFFLKYDIATDTWSQLPDAPAIITGYGGSLENYGGYIYFIRGGAGNQLYRYNIADSSWELPQRGFFAQSMPVAHATGQFSYRTFSNGSFVSDGDQDNVYLYRGPYDNLFGKYDTSSGEFTNLSSLPVGAYNGSTMVYDDDENSLYYTPGGISTVRTGANNYFFRYDIDSNAWSEINTVTYPNAQTGLGSTMVYDGDRYIYLTRGANTTAWWRYDTCHGQSSCTPNWSGNLFTGASTWTQTNGAQMVYRNGIIYALRGGGNLTFYSCDVQHTTFPAACWNQLASLPAGAVVNTGGTLVDGHDGYLYAALGNNTTNFYRYDLTGNTWTSVNTMPANFTTGASSAFQNYQMWSVAGAGTNTFSDGLYNYLVSSQTNGIGFQKTGSYVSDTFNLVSVYDWADLEVVYDLPDPGTTFVTIETRSSEDGTTWSDWAATSNDHVQEGGIGNPDTHKMSINSPVNPYLQARVSFTSSDHILSPRVDSLKVYYYQDVEAPNNPTAVTAYDKSDETTRTAITNPDGSSWFSYASPHFEWPAAGESGGAHDNPDPGGSGVAGYYVYFGEDPKGDPTVFQEDHSFTASGMTSGKTYYLRIQTVDNAGLPASDIFDAFTYNLDSTAPTAPTDINVIPLTYTSIDNFQFTWNSDATDPTPGSGLEKLQFCTGTCSPTDPTVWYDIADPASVSLTIPNEDHPEGAYQPGKNTLHLRVLDKAGNYSTDITQDYYFSASAPTPPEDLEANPADIVHENNFTFTWGKPLSFTGDPNKLTYYYSVNALPNAYNVIETLAQAAGPGPFATQYGANRFYVVAKDESGNIDYDLFAYVDFYAETVAPGPPLNAQAFDTSNRETAEYSVAVKWGVPTSYDSGNFAGYAIFRSDDDITYTEVATTTGTAFVDTGLESRLYYYYVKSKDKTNNYSTASSTVSLIPTGRYTTPPTLVGEPKVVTQSFAANFTWATNRVASSFVEFGKSMSLGETNGQVDSVTDHSVDVNGLSAGTKYYYRVKYIDPDGNIGTSDILNFTTLPPPTISDVQITDIVLNQAIVSWTTNTSATCKLSYGAGTNEETSGGSSHVQKITGLSADSSYTLKISCTDGDLNEFSSDEYTFTTPKQPLASDVTVQNQEDVDLPTVLINYTTNVPTTTLVYFKSSDEASQHTFLSTDKVTAHEAVLSGLDPAKEYTLSIGGTDENGINIIPIEQKITTKSDSRPPKITTNLSLGKVLGRGNSSQANVYIKVETDEVTTIKIKYAKGVVTSSLEQTASSDELNTYHLITIPAEPGQVYSYEVEAYDAVGNLTTSEITSVVVEKAKASATEVITGTFAERFGWLSSLWAK